MVASIALLHQTLASADLAAPLTSRQTHRPRQRRRAGLLGAAARPPCRRRPLQPLLWRPGPLLPLHPCRLQPRAAGRRVAPPLWSGLAAFWELVGPGNKGGGTMCAPVLRSGQAGRLTRIAKGTLLCQAVQTARSGCCFGLCRGRSVCVSTSCSIAGSPWRAKGARSPAPLDCSIRAQRDSLAIRRAHRFV